MSEAETDHQEPRKLHGAAAASAARKAGEGSALTKFLAAIDDGFDAAYQEASADVDAAQEALDEAKAKLTKLEAYRAVRDGKTSTDLLGDPIRRRTSTGPRAAKGEASTRVLEMLKKHPDGLTRGQLIEAMGAKGNKQMESSISNAITSLKKGPEPAIETKDGGLYVAA